MSSINFNNLSNNSFFSTSLEFPIFWAGCLAQIYGYLIWKTFISTLNLKCFLKSPPIFPWVSPLQLRLTWFYMNQKIYHLLSSIISSFNSCNNFLQWDMDILPIKSSFSLVTGLFIGKEIIISLISIAIL